MSATVSAITIDRLSEFGNRRRKLHLVRGWAMTVSTIIGLLCLGILLDSLFNHNWVRWASSIAVYGGGAIAWYQFCFRIARKTVTIEHEANCIEALDDRFREQLLSAVELGGLEQNGLLAVDSNAFRTQLQNHVAVRIAQLDVRGLLPWELIRRPLMLAMVGLGLVLLAAGIPQLHLNNRLARILLPGANLDRVTLVAISIVRPMPNDTLVPTGDVLAIEAIVDGAPSDLQLEHKTTSSGAISRLAMNPSAGRDTEEMPNGATFTANLATDANEILYRVVSGDASTAWHRISTLPRPSVLKYSKSLTPPDYTGLPTEFCEEEHGAFFAIEGTIAELVIACDQPLRTGQLIWQDGGRDGDSVAARQKTERLVLELIQDDAEGSANSTYRYRTQFVVDRTRDYRLHLIADGTGFDNRFSPTQKVVCVPDDPPEVAWSSSSRQQQVVAIDQVLPLEAIAEDEFRLDRAELWVRVNDEDNWRKMTSIDVTDPAPVSESSAMDSAVATDAILPKRENQTSRGSVAGRRFGIPLNTSLDLLKLELHAGDCVELKVTAMDRKGQEGNSDSLKLMVSTSSIWVEPSASELARQQLATELEAFQARVQSAAQNVDALLNMPPDPDRPNGKTEAAEAAANELSAAVITEVPKLLEMVVSAESHAASALDAQELERIGSALSTLRNQQQSALTKNEDKSTGSNSSKIRAKPQAASQAARIMAEAARTFVTRDVQNRLADQLGKMSAVLERLDEDGNQLDSESLNRRNLVAARQMKELQQHLLDALPFVRPQTQQNFRQSADQLANSIHQMENASNAADQLRKVVRLSASTLAEIARPNVLGGNLHEGIAAFNQRLNTITSEPAEAIKSSTQQWSKPPGNEDAAPSSQSLIAAIEHVKERRALERAREDADRQFANDLGKAAGAINEVIRQYPVPDKPSEQSLKSVSQATEVLQSIHTLREAASLLDELLRTERWQLDSVAGRFDNPLTLETLRERLERSSQLMRSASLPSELVDRVDRLRWNESVAQAEQKLNSRRWEKSPPVSASAELGQLQQLMNETLAAFDPAAEQARKKLDALNPTLGQLARRAADATRQLQSITEQVADEAAKDQLVNADQAIEQIKSGQLSVEEPLGQLRDALVDFADSKNLLDRDQLAKAKDADIAIGIVDQSNSDLKETIPQPVSDLSELNHRMSKAASKQSDVADNLEQLAKYLERESDGPAPASPADRNPLLELAEQLGKESSAFEKFSEAEKLARLAAAKPEEVLKQLEKQLGQNQSMQKEMSQIAREAAQQALNRLERAGRQQDSMRTQLEAADPELHASKRALLQDIQAIQEQSNAVLAMLASEAKWTAGTARQEVTQRHLEGIENLFRHELQSSTPVSMDSTFAELLRSANNIAKTLSDSRVSLQAAAEQLQQASSKPIHQNDADLANRRREMQDRQRRIAQQDVRNLEHAERSAQNRLRQFENEVKQAEQRERSLSQHRENVLRQLQQQPNSEDLKRQSEEAARNLAMSQLQRAAAERLRELSQRRVESASRAREQSAQRAPVELNGVNPSAVLSEELAQLAASRSEEFLRRLEDWVQISEPPTALPTGQQLQYSQQDQRSIGQAVRDSGDDLSRAARHEARLQNAATSQQLMEQSKQTAGVQSNEIQQAQQALQAANQSAQAAQSPTGQASHGEAQSTMTAIAQASKAIRQQSDQLRTMLEGQSSASQEKGRKSMPMENDSEKPASVLNAQQMAQLLDELDRQLNLGPKEADGNAATQKTEKGKSPPGTLAAAADQLSSQMSRERSPSPSPTTDQGMATESSKANADPQSPVAVRVMKVERVGEDWGKLRTEEAVGTQQSTRDAISSLYRLQTEAYFRSLGERGRK